MDYVQQILPTLSHSLPQSPYTYKVDDTVVYNILFGNHWVEITGKNSAD